MWSWILIILVFGLAAGFCATAVRGYVGVLRPGDGVRPGDGALDLPTVAFAVAAGICVLALGCLACVLLAGAYPPREYILSAVLFVVVLGCVLRLWRGPQSARVKKGLADLVGWLTEPTRR